MYRRSTPPPERHGLAPSLPQCAYPLVQLLTPPLVRCEVTAKVLLERFIVLRPHSWGALVTFIELLRNSKYDFWTKDFIRAAPEVTLLRESVSKVIACNTMLF